MIRPRLPRREAENPSDAPNSICVKSNLRVKISNLELISTSIVRYIKSMLWRHGAHNIEFNQVLQKFWEKLNGLFWGAEQKSITKKEENGT